MRPARSAATAMRAGGTMNDTRKKPSPPAPKPAPGSTITPSSSISRSANGRLGTPSGNAIQRYIVASGTSQENPAERNAATAASRRSLKIATFGGTNSFQLWIAATPAAWMPMNVPVSMNVFTFASAAEISGFATDQPQRQPVMLYVFDSE